jgi:serine/threonine protein phosphatase PrpC
MKIKTYAAIKHVESGENDWSQDQPVIYCADLKNEKKIGYVMLADPVGSSELSEKASETAIKVVQKKINQEMKKIKTNDNLEKLLNYAVSLANSHVILLNKKEKKRKPQENGATTLLVMTIYHKKGLIATVGDIRAYALYKDNEFKQVTEDETGAWLSYKQGHFNSRDETKVHPSSRDLKNAIGLLDRLKVQHHTIDLDDIDTIFIASDGYYKCLLDSEIKKSLQKKDPRNALESMNKITRQPEGIITLSMDVNGYDEETAKAVLKQDSKSAILLKEVYSNGL